MQILTSVFEGRVLFSFVNHQHRWNPRGVLLFCHNNPIFHLLEIRFCWFRKCNLLGGGLPLEELKDQLPNVFRVVAYQVCNWNSLDSLVTQDQFRRHLAFPKDFHKWFWTMTVASLHQTYLWIFWRGLFVISLCSSWGMTVAFATVYALIFTSLPAILRVIKLLGFFRISETLWNSTHRN